MFQYESFSYLLVIRRPQAMTALGRKLTDKICVAK